ncbi:MAG: SCP2 sterol-binding domain-containing protein [Betaproteobacteria bacterium]|nr:SCP2 sterol-binding domain-containing protein [Betaproteobacteria bacterium]
MTVIETPFAAALNHLLETESWASDRLAPFAGEVVRFRAPPLPDLTFEILADGRVAPTATATPTLTIHLGPEALPALARGEEHFMRAVGVSGNARLATEVLYLVRNLRWDVEEDLSGLIGDMAAHRAANLARDALAWQFDALKRIGASFAEYAIEERRMLVARAEFDDFSARVAQLRDAVERLEARVRRVA